MSQEWKGKTRGGLVGHQIFVWSLRNLGLNFCYFLLFWVSFYFVFFSPKTSVEIYSFYRKTNKFNPIKALFYIWKNYFYLGQTLVDKVAIYIGKKDEFTIVKPYMEAFNKMLSQDKPIILITSHIGNFEAAGHLVHIPRRFNLLLYEAELAQVKVFMETIKMESDISASIIKYDGSHVFQLAKVMENKEILCLHGDRFIEGSKFLSVEFFGDLARFPYGPFYMANRFETETAFISLIKSGHKEYTLEFHDLNSAQGAQGILNNYSKIMEKMVIKYPESWFNYFNFWKK